MHPDRLFQSIQEKRSLLCIGLDADPEKIPPHLHSFEDPVFEFNKRLIEATSAYAVAYKPNIAFYESRGVKGWESLRKTLEVIPDDILTIADAKRGDIGNTARMYARTFFETFDFDAITVAPYMGEDSVTPFLEFPDKWVFLLAMTSNPGASDFQFAGSPEDPLYQQVVKRAGTWAKNLPGHLGFVVGATRAEYLKEIRELAPKSFFLVPGVGAQGGSLQDVCDSGMNSRGGLLINSSRGIIFAGSGEDFAEKAAQKAKEMVADMKPYLQEKAIV